MEVKDYIMKTITPSEDMVITQKGEVDICDRILSTSTVFLGVNDSPDNYIEITLEEAKDYERLWNEYMENHSNDEPEDIEPIEDNIEDVTFIEEG